MTGECEYAGCAREGALERLDTGTDTLRWYCEQHDPLDAGTVQELFEEP